MIYQSSTGSSAVEWLLRRSDPLVVNYHNITPASFFEPWDDQAAASMRRARAQLGSLARRSRLAVADSPFNAAELTELGYDPVVVSPLLLDLDARLAAPDAAVAEHLARTRAGRHWLFVGRLAPNKCQHDLIAAFAAYRALYDPGARLTLDRQRGGGGVQRRALRPGRGSRAWRRRSRSPVRSPTRSWPRTTPTPTSSSASRATRASACPCSKPCATTCPWSPSPPARCPTRSAMPPCSWTTPRPIPSRPRSHTLLRDDPFRAALVAAGRAVVAAHSLASASAAFVDLIGRQLDAVGG